MRETVVDAGLDQTTILTSSLLIFDYCLLSSLLHFFMLIIPPTHLYPFLFPLK